MSKAKELVVISNGAVVAVDEVTSDGVLTRLAYTPYNSDEADKFAIAMGDQETLEFKGKVLRSCTDSEVLSFFLIALTWAQSNYDKQRIINGIKRDIYEAKV